MTSGAGGSAGSSFAVPGQSFGELAAKRRHLLRLDGRGLHQHRRNPRRNVDLQRTACRRATVDIPGRDQADGRTTALDRDDGLLTTVVQHRPGDAAAPRHAERHHRPLERPPATAAGGENEFEHLGAGLAGQRMTAAAGITVKAAQLQQASQDRNVVAAQKLGRRARKRRLRIVVRDRAAEAIVFQQPDRLEFQDRLRRTLQASSAIDRT